MSANLNFGRSAGGGGGGRGRGRRPVSKVEEKKQGQELVFPVGVKGSIIGKGGATIREIEEKSGATVKVSGTSES